MVSKVWFPNGRIYWAWSEDPAPPATNQNLAFDYLDGHTPLKFSETRPPETSAAKDITLRLRWSGTETRNVARGYWRWDGGDYGKSIAFAKPADPRRAP